MATSSGGAEAWSLERIVHALGSPSSLAYRSDEEHGTIGVWDQASHLATLRCTLDVSLLDVHAVVEPRAPWGRQPATDLLLGMVTLARESGTSHINVHAFDLLLRDEARRMGFSGGLRSSLSVDVDHLATGSDLRPPLPDMLEALIPGVLVTAGQRPGPLRRLSRRAKYGVPNVLELSVGRGNEGELLKVLVPDRADLLPEVVALAVDTVLAVRARFGRAGDHLRTLAFDQSYRELRPGGWGGIADLAAAVIHLNASRAVAEGVEAIYHRPERRSARPSARVPSRCAPIEATTAHECWHHIEWALEARRYQDSIDLRRELGRHFSVETLEQVILGGADDAPQSWRTAHERLALEASQYATTRTREATAELFRLWWCDLGQPTPAVRRFGELLERYFGVSRG